MNAFGFILLLLLLILLILHGVLDEKKAEEGSFVGVERLFTKKLPFLALGLLQRC